MASNKKDTSKDMNKGYEPKATARHAKKTRTKQEEIEILKNKIDTDRHLAKKYESNRKTEIKALAKEDRAAARAELKESVRNRKEAEMKDREKLRTLMHEERTEKGRTVKEEPFSEEDWLKGGRKKKKESKTSDAQPVPEVPEEKPADVPEGEGTYQTEQEAGEAAQKQ